MGMTTAGTFSLVTAAMDIMATLFVVIAGPVALAIIITFMIICCL
jgi:hypothetical protein